MVGDKEKVVIFGDGETAEIAYSYLSADSNYQVVGFSAEKQYIRHQTLFGLPVVPFEEVERFFDPKSHKALVAVSYTQMNRLRTKLYTQAKAKGYTFCSYISSKAFIEKTAQIGENCFIFEYVTIQYGAKIGNNTTIWSGTSIAHHSLIGENCFLASQVAVSGFCEIGENCFLGVNSCTVGGLKIARDCIIGAGAVVLKDTEAGKVYVGNPAKQLPNKTIDSFVSGREII